MRTAGPKRATCLAVLITALTGTLPAGADTTATGGTMEAILQRPPPPRQVEPLSLESAEYRSQRGALLTGASEAYARGITGRGVKVVVVDTKVAEGVSELQGQIAPGGFDLASDPRTATKFDHGTFVAGVIAARRDGRGFHGIAPGAQVIPVSIFNADSAFSMAGGYFGGLSRINETAVAAGARVINNSWGADSDGTVRVHSAFGPLLPSYRKAIQHGVVSVWAAGNDGMAEPSPQALAPLAWPELEAGWLVAVALDPDTGLKADFSNGCGAARNWCMAAPGKLITGQTADGKYYLAGGTSFAAPILSGALALLFETWPELTADQARQILFMTADDLGDPGTDGVYGRGGLNIARAFTPLGPPVVAGTDAPVQQTAAIPSGAIGGAMESGLSGAVLGVRDSFARDFAMPAAGLLSIDADARAERLAHGVRDLAGVWSGHLAGPVEGPGVARVFFATDRDGAPVAETGVGVSMYTGGGVLTLAQADGARGITDLPGLQSDMGAIPFAANAHPYFDMLGEGPAASWRAPLRGRWSWTATGSASTGAQGGSAVSAGIGWTGAAASVDVGIGTVVETGGFMGGPMRGAFGGGGRTTFLSAAGRIGLTPRLSVAAEAHLGHSRWDGSPTSLMPSADATTTAFGLGMALEDVAGGRLTAAVRQPLRAEGGRLAFSLPGPAGRQSLIADAEPDGRQIDLALGWTRVGMRSDLSLGIVQRFDAGHRAGEGETVLGARWRRRF